jgi:CheY-like chemotaxis protein
LRAAGDNPYRYVILDGDLQSPEMSAIQTAQAIREAAVGGDPRILMLTSADGNGDGLGNSASGADLFLVKPVRQSYLLNSLLAIHNNLLGAVPSSKSLLSRYRFSAEILLVEDAPVNLEVGLGMLEALGCRVDTACNGVEALEAIARKSYDAVLMDCQMPEMDGYEATRRIRELEKQPVDAATDGRSGLRHTIIALTAHAMQGERQVCLDAGMDDYLSKPFSMDGLGEVLSRWLPTTEADEASTHESPIQLVKTEMAALPSSADSSALASGQGRIDTAYLDVIRSMQRPGKADLLKTIIDQYIEDGLCQIEIMRKGYADGDAAAVRGASHRLKSSSANLGALWLADYCKELESICKEGRVPDDMTLITMIEEGYREARIQLEAFQEGRVA